MQIRVPLPDVTRALLRLTLLGLAYYATARVGLATPYIGSRITLVWLPTGIAVAAMYRWGFRYWPAVYAAAAVVNLQVGSSLLTALAIGAGNTLGPIGAAWLLARAGFVATFERPRDIPVFCIAASVGMMLPATGGVTSLLLAGELPIDQAAHAWATWWLGDMMGVLFAAPLLLSIRRGAVRSLINRHTEFLVLCVAGAAILIGVLINAHPASVAPPALFLPLLLILWTAVRFGVTVTSFAALVIALFAAWGVATGHGPFQSADVQAGLRALWAYLAILTVLGLLVAAVAADRARIEASVRDAKSQYRSLFEVNPQPMWVYDRGTLRFLAVNNAAIAHYGYSRDEFLAMTIKDIRPPEDVPSFLAALAGEAGQFGPSRSWRHRLKDGRIIDVEIVRDCLQYAGRDASLALATDVTERKRLERVVLDSSAREQRLLSHQLHDGLGQELTGLALMAKGLAAGATKGQAVEAADLQKLSDWASRSIATCRTIAQGLSPVGDSRGGLEEAIRNLALVHQGPGIPPVWFDAVASSTLRLTTEASDHLYRIAQEGLTNALRHAGAKSISIVLEVQPNIVRLEILDDGCGVPVTSVESNGMGLRIMRYRAAVIGARLAVARREGAGTKLVCECPQPVPRHERLPSETTGLAVIALADGLRNGVA